MDAVTSGARNNLPYRSERSNNPTLSAYEGPRKGAFSYAER